MPSQDRKTRKAKEFATFVVDCTQQVNDEIFDMVGFTKYLTDRIKVNGKTGQLGDSVTIDNPTDGKVSVTARLPFSKRYLKYLTKRFLKNQQIRDFLRVVAGQSKDTYVLKYLEVPGADQEEES